MFTLKRKKLVYFFGDKKAEGNAKMKDILGGKGAGLAEMTKIGIPVPAGFTISTDVCEYFYKNNKIYPPRLEDCVKENLKKLEITTGKKFGDSENPLLVSVRSGASISMPGMMDTILNLGINNVAVEGLAKKTNDERFAYDTYRRFIQMFGNVVKNIEIEEFENAMLEVKNKYQITDDKKLQKDELKEIIAKYFDIYKKHTDEDFPQNPVMQLWMAIDAVFGSWMNERAVKYREFHDIKGIKGTAVNVQSMVFGNYGDNSGTGVCFSRNPTTGEKEIYGEYLQNAQGEDVVAGIRTPKKIDELKTQFPSIYSQLFNAINMLEKHYKDMQDVEFTVSNGKLYLLQTRSGKRTGIASIKCAVDMVKEGLITKETAIKRITTENIQQLLFSKTDDADEKRAIAENMLVATGMSASLGAGCGEITFTAKEAEKRKQQGKKVVLIRQNTSPEDIAGMIVAEAVLTSTGGMTSHAAIVSRSIGTPCVICPDMLRFENIGGEECVFINGKKFKQGDIITIDGTTGKVFGCEVKLIKSGLNDVVNEFLGWCDDVCKKSVRKFKNDGRTIKISGFDVMANADLPSDAKNAVNFGAKGIGLCRTEHMFFDKEKLMPFRAMICSDSKEERVKYLNEILELQRTDFEGIFKEMEGKEVIVRLLDPPLHEFLPKTEEEFDSVAKYMQVSKEELKKKTSSLFETNPMMGHRGCRLAITYPEIYEMQTQAITEAVANCLKNGIDARAKIMIPIVCDAGEFKFVENVCRKKIDEVIKKIDDTQDANVVEVLKNMQIGTMIEVPRATLQADEIAKSADFFSFGTNDLTQTTFAFSRDDVSKMLDCYFENEIFENNPFKTIDVKGVGELVKIAVKGGRKSKKDLHIGICGEHGGDEKTIAFCYKNGLNYVSCSPYRVPCARLCCAKAVLLNK